MLNTGYAYRAGWLHGDGSDGVLEVRDSDFTLSRDCQFEMILFYGKGKGKGTVYMNGYSLRVQKGEIDWVRVLDKPPVSLQCECGAEKCGSNAHSHWCPKDIV